MSRLDALSPHWNEISALLDEAMALPAAERPLWLESLAGQRAAFKDTLRELLASSAGVETHDFLGELPRVEGLAASADAGSLVTEPAAGAMVGPYRLVSELGQGGMGAVWLAERADGQLKRRVALKLPRLAWGSALAERLARERDILASLEHPNIARLYDAGVDAHGRPYFAMEWVEGQPIDVYCRERAMPLRGRIELLLQVCDAVAHAHSRLVVHRDLKPGNILVTADGQVRLLDFGIAKLMEGDRTEETALTRQAGRALTLDYASPEQIAGAPLGTASDVYSLGVVAYELLAGCRPYRLKRGSAAELEEAIAHADPPRASDAAAEPALKRALRGDLDAILNKALKKDTAERYPAIAALADDLGRHLQGFAVLARPDSRLYRLRKFVVRNRLAVGASGAVALALVAASGVSLWQASVAQRQAQRALAVQEFMTDIFRTNSINQADPLKARQTTAVELLDIGAQRIEHNLQADPEGRADVLGLLSDMYFDLGLDPKSAEFYRRRAQALKQAHGPRDARVARALAEYAKRIDQTGRDDEQRRALDEAKAILDALGDNQSEARALWLEAMAKAEALAGDKAVAWAEQAVAIYRHHHPQSKSFSGALNRLGIARTVVDDHAGAEAAFVESLKLLQRDPQANVSLLITGTLMLAGAQARQHKIVAAENTYRRTLELTLQRNGALHVDTLYVQAWFGWFLHRTCRRAEAWSLLLAAEEALRRSSFPSFTTNTVKMHLAYAVLAEGRFGDAEPWIDGLISEFRSIAGGKNWLLVNFLRMQALQRLGQGRMAEAEQSLAEAWARHDELAPEQRRIATNALALASARLAISRGQADAALKALARMHGSSDGASATLQPDALSAQALRAEVFLLQQRIEQARETAQAVVDRLAASELRGHYKAHEADALLPLAQALQREGQVDAACSALDNALKLRLASLGERSPYVAETERALAECQLAQQGLSARAPNHPTGAK